ncbi:MAG: ComEC/Rec2 family competence protein [Candidatus Gracilibacteria bacterium]|nr:ComEC/Rec2 family competence protein [Candidatus Gracilibacteria bacterium]
MIIGFSLGICVSQYNKGNIEANKLIVNEITNKNKIESEITKISKIDEKYTVYLGKLIKIDDKIINKNIYFEIYLNGNYKLENKSLIEFNSKIFLYESFNGFDYNKYMLSKDTYFKTYPYTYEKIGINKENIIIKGIENLRNNMLKIINTIYTKDEAVFLGGILLGARESMPKELSTNFNNSGLTHLIAVSGFNITIIIIFFGYIIKPFPNYLKVVLMSLIIVLFTILVGYGAAVIRASIMGIIGYIVISSGRQGNILSIIVLTLVLMVSFSPLSINYDISLHLSFLAVLGIIYSQKYIESIFSFLPNIFEIKTAFCLTISAMIFTLPIMLFNFGQVSIISPLSNLLVIWTIPIAMLFGFLSIILYYITPILGIIIGYIAWILLKWDILIVNYFGSSIYSTIKYDFGEYRGYYELIYFFILTFIILWFKKTKTD